jgi:hypothetical protein
LRRLSALVISCITARQRAGRVASMMPLIPSNSC